MCEAMRSRPFGARAKLALSEALRRTGGDTDRAAELRAAGTAVAVELGMDPVLGFYSTR